MTGVYVFSAVELNAIAAADVVPSGNSIAVQRPA